MSRQTRLIVIIAGMALVGVVMLIMVAGRYTKLVANRGDGDGQTTEQAVRVAEAQVAKFVAIRQALRETVDSGKFDGVAPNARALAFSVERNRVLSAARVHEADYRELRGHFRQWAKDPTRLAEVWQNAFEIHRDQLAGCDLGELESADR